jgi:siroheme synthase
MRACCAARGPTPNASMSVRRRPKPLEQDAICFLLAEKARDGKTVVRLKWGDPFVFDSGGKEALFLHEHGVPFEVVPGFPSLSAARPTRDTGHLP